MAWTREGLEFLLEQVERMTVKCVMVEAEERIKLVQEVYLQLQRELEYLPVPRLDGPKISGISTPEFDPLKFY